MKKKILLIGLISIFMITNVLAIWIVSISSTATYSIESQAYGGLVINKDLSGGAFNSLNGSIDSLDEFIFTNEGVVTDVNITVSTIRTPTDQSCTNWINDCEVEYYFNGDSSDRLFDGTETKTIINGENKIAVNISCYQYSCPQEIIPTIDVKKLPV